MLNILSIVLNAGTEDYCNTS